MAIWLLIMFVGLAALGYVFYKVWTAPATGIERKWLVWAFVGTLVSIVGLVMTLRYVQKEPSEMIIPQAKMEPVAPQPGGKPTPPAATQPGAPGTPETQQPGHEGGIPKYERNKIPENPAGPTFTKEDINFFTGEATRILNKLDEQMSLENQPGRHEDAATKANRWRLFYEDYELWLSTFRGRAAAKTGPGTDHIRQMVYSMSENLEKMVRVSYNAYVANLEPDMSYLSDLRGNIERLSENIQKETPK